MSALVEIDALSEEQLIAMLEVKKNQREAEEARRHAAEEAHHRAQQETKRKAEEDKKRAEEEERKKAENGNKKTGDEGSDRCTACIRTDMLCTFSVVGTKATSCDGCRSGKKLCMFPARDADKPRRRKRRDEVEMPCGGNGKKRARQLSPSPMEVEEILVVAVLEVLAEKVQQLTHVVAEGFASHWKEQQRIITALNSISGVLENQEQASKASGIEKDNSKFK
ncbi:hypothetical protein AZE42_04123 [Rhizopogon vesiculosus]|uniref:Uncharacterized protein n=1 Tax=Rhizopogon vesiculosus TaxID=180088 RepID=A0A1J8QLL9_9AGAM|nr:hypothetical protein AZE42_04123 [Rhizopogon vesiculosus]